MTHVRLLIILSLLATPLAGADQASSSTATKAAPPTTRPTDEQQKRINSLLRELAFDEVAARERASRELEKLGRIALPSLKAAMESDDPSVQTHARWLIHEIERPKDEPLIELEGQVVIGEFGDLQGRIALGRDFKALGWNGGGVALGNFGAARSLVIKHDGRHIVLHRAEDGGITIDVAGDDQEKQHVVAANEAELKEKHPDTFKLYAQYKNLLDRQQGRLQLRANVGAVEDNRTFRMVEGNRIVEIDQQGDAGKVKVTLRDAASKKIIETFEANSPDELRKAHPEVGKLYDRFAHLMEPGIPVLNKIPHLGRLFIHPKAQVEIRRRDEKAAADLRSRLDTALREAGVSDEQRQQIIQRTTESLRERPDGQIVIESDPSGTRAVEK